MIVTKIEFEANPSRYLDLVDEEEIVITDDGGYVARLTGARTGVVDSLVGLIPSTVTDEEVRRGRLEKYEYSL